MPGERNQLSPSVSLRAVLTEKALAAVLELEVLIGKLLTIDGFPASSVTIGEVTALDHEVLDDPMEGASLVSEAFLASGQCSKILDSLQRWSAFMPPPNVSFCIPRGRYRHRDPSLSARAPYRLARYRSTPSWLS
jgi:hypothetical protein